jgi:NAD(P)-dependent dehydrogenase (short-subunit alcohol dehydrogenase family)
MQLSGAVALVTGANRGLGRRFAEQLVERGAKVYAAARNTDSITVEGVTPLHVDVNDPKSVAAAADIASDVILLVNIAGNYNTATLLDGSLDDDIRSVMESHYFGTLSVTRAFAPHLAANAPAAILNVVSVLSWVHPGSLGAYASAKTALWAQTDAIREELAPRSVAVTSLHVAYMDTDMMAAVEAPKTDPGTVAAAALDGVERGDVEVLADALTKDVKASMSQDRGYTPAGPPAH